MNKKSIQFVLVMMLAAVGAAAQDSVKVIPAGSKVFIGPLKDGFETELAVALQAKKVPLETVADRSAAEFEISGTSESKKAGAAKIILMGSWRSSEQASITVTNLKNGEAVWAYSVNKSDSAHGKRSTAEACAKHLKEKIESGK
jgi:hypothetical protein